MTIEVIAIGDEILSGNIVDTNTAYLSDKLWIEGLEVTYHSAVRDDPPKIREALLLAADRAELVLVTGGLGPTADDFTLEIAAKTFRRKLVLNQPYLQYLKNLYRKWGRTMSANNEKQAVIPEGAKTFENRVGTAPGVEVIYKKTAFYFMPGVPAEMKQLFQDFILPEILRARKSKKIFKSKVLRCFGLPESDLDYALKDLYHERLMIENVRVGFRAHFPETLIKLSAWDNNADAAMGRLTKIAAKIRERLKDTVYGEGDDTLESVVGRLMREQNKTLALAESCTGGLVANRITNIPGSSDFFRHGVVSYSNESKVNILEVQKSTLDRHGAVSSSCAKEMAQGVRRISRADYGLAVTGIAGPTGGTDEKPVGTVHVALASAQGSWEKKYFFPFKRDWFKLVVSSVAVDRLRREFLKLAPLEQVKKIQID